MTNPNPAPPADDQPRDGDPQSDDRPDDDGQGDPTPAPDEDQDWTPPGRPEWDRVVGTLKKRKDEIRDLRRENAELKTKKPDTGEAPEPPDPRDAELAKLRETAARSAARAALSAAGFSGSKEQAARALRMLDLAQAQPDRNGDYDFDDDIDDLKADFPALFAPAAPEPGQRRRTARVDTRDQDPDGGNRRSTSDALLRQAGYR